MDVPAQLTIRLLRVIQNLVLKFPNCLLITVNIVIILRLVLWLTQEEFPPFVSTITKIVVFLIGVVLLVTTSFSINFGYKMIQCMSGNLRLGSYWLKPSFVVAAINSTIHYVQLYYLVHNVWVKDFYTPIKLYLHIIPTLFLIASAVLRHAIVNICSCYTKQNWQKLTRNQQVTFKQCLAFQIEVNKSVGLYSASMLLVVGKRIIMNGGIDILILLTVIVLGHEVLGHLETNRFFVGLGDSFSIGNYVAEAQDNTRSKLVVPNHSALLPSAVQPRLPQHVSDTPFFIPSGFDYQYPLMNIPLWLFLGECPAKDNGNSDLEDTFTACVRVTGPH